MPQVPRQKRREKKIRGVSIPSPAQDGTIRFSFKYAQFPRDGNKFCIADRDATYFLALLGRLTNVCTMPSGEFRTSSRALRSHPIRFGKNDGITEPGFECLPLRLRDEVENSARQFSVSANAHGRVHGFLIADVFFVVWWDPRHELYP